MFNNIPPITRNIIIINIVVFILTYVLQTDLMYRYLAAFYPFSPFFHSWQIITHMFMHGSFMHILFNLMTLYSFGPVLEQVLGDKKYVILYIIYRKERCVNGKMCYTENMTWKELVKCWKK